jgi:uncharacterized protein YacL
MKIFELLIASSILAVFVVHEFIFETSELFSVFLLIGTLFYFFSGIPVIMGITLKKTFEKVEKKNNKYLIFAGGVGIIISFSLMGIMFKVLNWPNWKLMLLTMGTICTFFIGLSFYYFIKRKNKAFLNALIRLGIIIVSEAYSLYYL